MTIRLDDRSLRLRLSEADLETLDREGEVETRTPFSADAALRYRLRAAGVNCIGARFDDEGVTVSVPHELVRGWTSDERVGFEEVQPTGGDEPLRILVEKDLGCRHGKSAEG